jgi:hypothetical protein
VASVIPLFLAVLINSAANRLFVCGRILFLRLVVNCALTDGTTYGSLSTSFDGALVVELHECLKRLKETRYSVEPEDCVDLSDGLSTAEDFKSLCLEIAEAAVDYELQAKAVAERAAEMAERNGRLLRTAENLRNVILQSMEIRGEKTIASPTLTLSVSQRSGDLVINDEALIPSRFFKPQPPVLDKKALKEAVVTDGEVIDGATLGNGSISLSIRRK